MSWALESLVPDVRSLCSGSIRHVDRNSCERVVQGGRSEPKAEVGFCFRSHLDIVVGGPRVVINGATIGRATMAMIAGRVVGLA